MIRTTASRPISRGLNNVISTRLGYSFAQKRVCVASHFHSLAAKRPQVVISPIRPVIVPQLRYATKTGTPKFDKIDKEAEKKLTGVKLGSDPEAVTTDSSVRKVVEPSKAVPEEDNEILGGAKPSIPCRESAKYSPVNAANWVIRAYSGGISMVGQAIAGIATPMAYLR